MVTTVPLTNDQGLGLGALVVGDFNEDGKSDLAVATIAGNQVCIVFLGNGDGTFRQQTPIPNSFGFLAAKVADLNGDHHQDLVFAENGNISVSLGNGDGTFSSSVGLIGSSFPGTYPTVAVADFNGDGKLDIAAPDFVDESFGTLDFWAGKGDGTFAVGTATTSPPGSRCFYCQRGFRW